MITILHGLEPVISALVDVPDIYAKLKEVETDLLKLALSLEK